MATLPLSLAIHLLSAATVSTLLLLLLHELQELPLWLEVLSRDVGVCGLTTAAV